MITVGCDVGSLFVKAVVLRDEEIAATLITRTTGTLTAELDGHLERLLKDAGVSPDRVDALGATGRGATHVSSADFIEDETTCVAAATWYYLPGVALAIHIGGQSIAAIRVGADGEVAGMVRNDKCASGTGRFLEMMAHKLGIPWADLDATAAGAARPTRISGQCVVFAESEVISHVNAGAPLPDVVAGICESLAGMVVSQGRRFSDVPTLTMTGGVARLSAVTGPVSRRLEGEYRAFPHDPQLAAAIGAALMEDVGDGEV